MVAFQTRLLEHCAKLEALKISTKQLKVRPPAEYEHMDSTQKAAAENTQTEWEVKADAALKTLDGHVKKVHRHLRPDSVHDSRRPDNSC